MTALSPASGRGLDAAQLYERYGAQLYRFCLGRLRSPEEAEDAVQNVFLRVHTALQKGVVPEFETAWLYKIAHNVCLSRIESRGRRSQLETPSDLDEMEYMLAAPEHDHEPLDGLADALAELPHNLRQALLLREWQGLSQTEIADAMATTVSAVETLLYRARKQLATALEQGGRRGRRVVAGVFNVFGLRALLSRLLGALAGAGPGPVAAGVAALALGGSGIGAAVVLGTANGHAPTPAQNPGGDLPPHRIGTPAGGSAAFGGTATSRPAGAAVYFRTIVPVEPAPAAPAAQPAAAPTIPAAPSRATAPSLPAAPMQTVATPTLPAAPSTDVSSTLDPAVTTATAVAGSAVAAVTTATATATAANSVTTASAPSAPSAPSVPSLPVSGLDG